MKYIAYILTITFVTVALIIILFAIYNIPTVTLMRISQEIGAEPYELIVYGIVHKPGRKSVPGLLNENEITIYSTDSRPSAAWKVASGMSQ